MAKPHLLDNLIAWFRRDQWSDYADDVFSEFFSDVLAEYDITFEDAVPLLGDVSSTAVWGCYFEAAVTQPCEEADEGSILDNYLKRRGWKESATTRRYMKALGDSIFSVHEVVAVVPGESLVLKDLLLDSEPLTVVEHSASQSLRAGEFLAARVVDLGSNYGLTGGLLRLSPKAGEAVVSGVREAFGRLEDAMAEGGELEELATEADAGVAKRIILDTQISSIVQLWLDEALSTRIEKLPPPSLNADGEPLLFVQLSYDVSQPGEVIGRLKAAPFLIEADDESWYWLNEQDVSDHLLGMDAGGFRNRERLLVEFEDGTQVLGRLDLEDTRLVVAVNSKRRAERIQLLLGPRLAGLIGPISIEERTMDQLMDEPDDTSNGAPMEMPLSRRSA